MEPNIRGSLSKQLRLLAKAIDDNGDMPDFVFCIVLDGTPHSTHHCSEDIFRLIGVTQVRLKEMLEEVD